MKVSNAGENNSKGDQKISNMNGNVRNVEKQ